MPELNLFHGVDYFRSADKLAEDQVSSANNLDFSLVRGGAAVRKGSTQITNIGTGVGGLHLFRFYNAASAPPWYIPTDGGNLLRIDGGFSSPAITTVTNGFVTDVNKLTAFGSFRNHAFFASGTTAIREIAGTALVDWVKTPPEDPLTLTTSTLTALNVVDTATISEGITQAATFVLATASNTATATVDADTNRLTMLCSLTSTNLNLNGTNTIGDLGVHHLDLNFSDPKAIDTISIDYSVGDDTFDTYYHAAINVVDARFDLDMKYGLNEGDATADDLADSILTKNDEGVPPTIDEVSEARSVAIHRSRRRAQRISRAPDTFNTWSVPVTKFELVGKAPTDGFGNIGACRLVVESADPSLVVKLRNWNIVGAETYPLNDPQVGYAYWETFGRVETVDGENVLVDQSGPSPVSERIKVSGGRVQIVSTNTSTDTSITHRVFYRQGGFMRDSYAVATVAVATDTFTDTLSDMAVLMQNWAMPRNLRTSVPEDVRALAQFRGRIFYAWDNKIGWSEPNNPGALPKDSWTQVSYDFDLVQALIPAGNTLVIVNRDTVYTLRGSIFEGINQDWVLEKTTAKGGSRAPRTAKATPFGILLVREGGLFMYDPGAATDRPIVWAMEKVGDIFRGNSSADPAAQKGSRITGADQAAWINATAVWYNDQIWLAYADDSSSSSSNKPTKVIVLDFRTENAWTYTYPFEINDLFADLDSNALLVVTPGGGFMRLENSLIDEGAGGTSTAIQWNLRSRVWTTPADAVAENLFVELDNAADVVCKAIFDGTDTDTLGTLAGANRDWYNPPLNGVFHHSVEFDISGTAPSGSQGMLFSLQYDLLPEPKRVNYWRTPHELAGYDGDKIWDVHFSDIEVIGTGNVLAPVYVDNTAVMTATIAGPTNGRIIYEKSFPVSTDGYATIGEVAYTTYTSTDPVEFKLWKTSYAARKEPPKMTEHQERISCNDEHLWRNYNVCVTPGSDSGHTMTHEVFIDGTSVTTFTSTGDRRQSYAYAMPLNTYGRTAIVVHRAISSAFKFFESWWDITKEPDRVLNYQWYPASFPSDSFPKTLVTELDCLGGTISGVVYLDGTAVATEAFTGNGRQTYNRALDLNSSNALWDGTRIEVDYTGAAVFKHYSTLVEYERKPFGKKEWAFTFRKLGGATRLDMGIDYSLDIEAEGTATVTYAWDIDNGQFQTGTEVIIGRQWLDMRPLGPGMRSRLFKLRLWSSTDFHVYSAGLDVEREGRKGVSIVAVQGTPDNAITMHNESPPEIIPGGQGG